VKVKNETAVKPLDVLCLSEILILLKVGRAYKDGKTKFDNSEFTSWITHCDRLSIQLKDLPTIKAKLKVLRYSINVIIAANRKGRPTRCRSLSLNQLNHLLLSVIVTPVTDKRDLLKAS